MSSEIDNFIDFLNNIRGVPEHAFWTEDGDELFPDSELVSDQAWDEISILADSLLSTLPKQFIELVNNPTRPLTFKLIYRLSHMLSVYKRLNHSEINTDQIDEITPHFQLTKPDKDGIYTLCEQIRKIVFAESSFDEAHRRRLLNRITAVEKEVGKDKGMFDTIIGMVSDFGETIGKFGKDIKPLTDRVNEIAKITRNGSEEYRQLPAPDEIKAIEDKSGEL